MRLRSSSWSFASCSLDLTMATSSGLILQICLIMALQALQVHLSQWPSFTGMEHGAPHARAVYKIKNLAWNCEHFFTHQLLHVLGAQKSVGLHYTQIFMHQLWLFSYTSVKTYVLSAQKSRLNEMFLLGAHNICFGWEIRGACYLSFWTLNFELSLIIFKRLSMGDPEGGQGESRKLLNLIFLYVFQTDFRR